MPRISSKNQITIPVDMMRAGDLQPGDDVVVRSLGRGRLEIERVSDRAQRIIDKFAGSMPPDTYPPGYLDELRDEWER